MKKMFNVRPLFGDAAEKAKAAVESAEASRAGVLPPQVAELLESAKECVADPPGILGEEQ